MRFIALIAAIQSYFHGVSAGTVLFKSLIFLFSCVLKSNICNEFDTLSESI